MEREEAIEILAYLPMDKVVCTDERVFSAILIAIADMRVCQENRRLADAERCAHDRALRNVFWEDSIKEESV